jgi:hypothetical protein
MSTAGVEILALDIEGTLVSNAVSQIARPGLRDFLQFCRERFPRVVVYTVVDERTFRLLAPQLILDEAAPRWFGDLVHVHWTAEHKDLRLIPEAVPERALLVDDLEECVHPEQKDRWIRVAPFERPYPASDSELARVRAVLSAHLR